jgi:predicted amidohydrolase YtcJ
MTGEAVETAARQIRMNLPEPPMSHVRRTILTAVSRCHRYGITPCQEASANTNFLHALRELESERQLKMDIYTHVVCLPSGFTYESEDTLRALLDVAEGFRSKHIHTNFVKLLWIAHLFRLNLRKWISTPMEPPNPNSV